MANISVYISTKHFLALQNLPDVFKTQVTKLAREEIESAIEYYTELNKKDNEQEQEL